MEYGGGGDKMIEGSWRVEMLVLSLEDFRSMIFVTGTVGYNKGVVFFKAATFTFPMSMGQKAGIYVDTVAQPAEPDMSN